jgi:hypothetical protein
MQRPRMKIMKHGRRGLVLAAALASLLAGCKIVDTQPIRMANGQLCQTALGAYFLPKSNIKITITQGDAALPPKFTLNDPTPTADRNQIYCLDYLGSPLAEDTVNVIREDLGTLARITSIADDKSKAIALKALQIGLIAATGNPDVELRDADFGTLGTEQLLISHDFDPFDRPKLAEINTVLGSVYGYCLTVDGHTLPSAHTQSYCSAPRNYEIKRQTSSPDEPSALANLEEANRGILYRPNQTFQLLVFRRPPKSYGVWKLYQTKQVEMPNIAPIFSIGVDRTMFVKRTTTLEFENGVLKNIFIEKPSEALEFVEIPLRVVQALVKVPAEIVKVRIAATNNQKQIIEAQQGLIQNQLAAVEAANALRSASIANADGTTRSGALPPRLRFVSSPNPAVENSCKGFCIGKKPSCMTRCRMTAPICPSLKPAEFHACLELHLKEE